MHGHMPTHLFIITFFTNAIFLYIFKSENILFICSNTQSANRSLFSLSRI